MRQTVRRMFQVAAMTGLVLAFVLAPTAPAEGSRPTRDDLRAAAAAEPTSPARKAVPDEAEVASIVKETLELFVRSVAARDMGPLRAEATVGVQRQLSATEINETFRPFFVVGLAPTMLEGLSPVITASRAIGSDGLAVEGHFTSEPQPLAFRLSFVREGLVWRWSYIHVALMPADVRPGQ